MRTRFPSLVLAIIVMGLSASSIHAQTANDSSQADKAKAKPCIVVYGAVRAPARIEVRRLLRLAELIAVVGGFTERVGQTVRVIHTERGSSCDQAAQTNQIRKSFPAPSEVYNLEDLKGGDKKANPYLQPGDVVIVEELPPVYITGSVKQPQSIYLKSRLTLTHAIATAGGELPDSNIKQVKIYRSNTPGDSRQMVTLTFDLTAIKKHPGDNPILQPYDVVEVPSTKPGMIRPWTLNPTFDPRPLLPCVYTGFKSTKIDSIQ